MKKSEFIESMKVMNFKPGDILVLKVPFTLPVGVGKKLIGAVEKIVKGKCQVMILEQGMDIGIMREKGVK